MAEDISINSLYEIVRNESVKAFISYSISKWCPIISKKLHNFQNSTLLQNRLQKILPEYLERVIEDNIYMNGFVYRGQGKTIDELYTPLKLKSISQSSNRILVDASFFDTLEKSICNAKKMQEHYDEQYRKREILQPISVRLPRRRLLIVDDAGMGKSTLVQYLSIESIKREKSIPIVVELRKLKKGSLIDFIRKELSILDISISSDDFYALFKSGSFTIFLDGYDEMPFRQRDSFLDEIDKLASSVGENYLIMTTRQDNSIVALSKKFDTYSIERFSLDDAHQFIAKYDETVGIAENLWKHLEHFNNQVLIEFTSNPLMVTLLYLSFSHSGELFASKGDFYKKVFVALYQEHDINKGGNFKHTKLSGLDIGDFFLVMSYIGYESVVKNLRDFDAISINGVVKRAKRKTKTSFKPEHFIHDISVSVQLMRKEDFVLTWIHRSFAEYFAASFLSDDLKHVDQLLRNPLHNKVVLAFCCEHNEKLQKYICNSIIKRARREYLTTYSRDKYGVDWLAVGREFAKRYPMDIVVKLYPQQIVIGPYEHPDEPLYGGLFGLVYVGVGEYGFQTYFRIDDIEIE